MKNHRHKFRKGSPCCKPFLHHRVARFEPLEERQMLAVTLHVDGESPEAGDGLTWQTAHQSLQTALAEAGSRNADADSDNDVSQIWIADGTYVPGTSRGSSFSLREGVSLYGGFEGQSAPTPEVSLGDRTRDDDGKLLYQTILSGDVLGNDAPMETVIHEDNPIHHESRQDNCYIVVYANGVKDVTIDGLTIAGGNANAPGWYTWNEQGGGVHARAGAELQFSEVVFRGNTGGRNGGAVHADGSTLVFGDCIFEHNHSSWKGGGIGAVSGGVIVVDNSLFFENRGDAIYSWGGSMEIDGVDFIGNLDGGFSSYTVWKDGGTLDISNSLFRDNHASGSIVSMREGTVSDTVIDANSSSGIGIGGYGDIVRCRIMNNTTSGNGGGVIASGYSHQYGRFGNTRIVDSVITGNRAGGDGGGVYVQYGNTQIINSLVTGNISENGGGIALSSFAQPSMSLEVHQSTIIDNVALQYGGGIWAEDDDRLSATLKNSLITRNRAVLDGNDVHDIAGILTDTSDYNLIGEWDAEALPGGHSVVGTSDAPLDPRLSDLVTLPNDTLGYYLLDDSPAIDAGNDAWAVDQNGDPLVSDVYGDARIQGDAVNIGAIETVTQRVSGTTYVVQSLVPTIAKDGELTFAEALAAANINMPVGDAVAGSFSDRDTIRFAEGLSGILLAETEPYRIDGSLEIVGPGIEQLTLDAEAGLGRAVEVGQSGDLILSGMTAIGNTDGAIVNYGRLAVQDMRFAGRQGESEAGRGIYNDEGWLSVASTEFSNLGKDYGAAIRMNRGVLDVAGSQFFDNTAAEDGGAIYSDKSMIQFGESRFEGNAASSGGAIFSTEGVIEIQKTVFEANASTKPWNYNPYDQGGGALAIAANSSFFTHVSISKSEFIQNRSVDDASALYIDGFNWFDTVISDSVFRENTANNNRTIHSRKARLEMSECEITNNGILNGSITAVEANHLKMTSCLVADNWSVSSENDDLSTSVRSSIVGTESLELTNCIITRNSGAVGAEGTTNIIASCEITDNHSNNGGGVRARGNTTITDTLIARNWTNYKGGGILSHAKNLAVERCRIVDNVIDGNGSGAGIYVNQFACNLTLIDSEVTGNTSGPYGGGIFFHYGDPSADTSHQIINSTIADNTAKWNAGGIFYGSQGVIDITNSTIVGNTSLDEYNLGNPTAGLHGGGTRVTLHNTIIADNVNVHGEQRDLVHLPNENSDHNLIGVWDGDPLPGENNLVGTSQMPLDPKLARLGWYGGPTRTLPPLEGSPAIDSGDDSTSAWPEGVTPFDQRGEGFDRIAGTAIDLGAAEWNPEHFFLVDHTPTQYLNAATSQVELLFNREVDLTSFTPDQVSLVGQQGPVTINNVQRIGDNRYAIQFGTLPESGMYRLTVLPSIMDQTVQMLDLDFDGDHGESNDDVIVMHFRADLEPPRIVRHVPGGDISGTLHYVDLYFSTPINPETFTTDDLLIADALDQEIESTSVERITDSCYRVYVPPQTNTGTYHATVHSSIEDVAGNLLDSNDNGLGGEVNDDYSWTISLVDVDLEISNIALSTDRIAMSNTLNVSWIGGNSYQTDLLGDWTDALYLSRDTEWSIDDLLLAKVNHRDGLAAGETYSGMATISIPGVWPDDYYILVRADVHNHEKEGANEENNVGASAPLDVYMPRLSLNDSVSGQLSADDAFDYFAITVPQDTDVQLALDGLIDHGESEIYIAYERIPTREDFDYRSRPHTPDVSYLIPRTYNGGTFYVMVHSHRPYDGYDYTLSSTENPLVVNHMTPTGGSCSSRTTFEFFGAGFAEDVQVVLINDDDQAFHPEIINHTNEYLRVAFEEDVLSEGEYRAIIHTTTRTFEMPQLVEMIDQSGAEFVATLTLPGQRRPGGEGTGYLTYYNYGFDPLTAPLVTVVATKGGEDAAFMSLEKSVIEAYRGTTASSPLGSSLQVIASGHTLGVLQPTFPEPDDQYVVADSNSLQPAAGAKYIINTNTPPEERITVPFYFQLDPEAGIGNYEFRVGYVHVDDPTPINWGGLSSALRPESIEPEAWSLITENLAMQTGDSWGDYVTMLNENMLYLSGAGVPFLREVGSKTLDVLRFGVSRIRTDPEREIMMGVSIGGSSRSSGPRDSRVVARDQKNQLVEGIDPADLLAFEILQASGMSPVTTLASSTDFAVTSPGMDLVFSRIYANSIPSRFSQSELGYGWSHNWEYSLVENAEGTVVVSEPGGTTRTFQRDYFGKYHELGENPGTLTKSGDLYVITESVGGKSAYDAAGRLEYVEDANGNRVTCSYQEGQLSKLTHSGGQWLEFSYNEQGLLATIADQHGRSVEYGYDAGHLTEATSFQGLTVGYHYSDETAHALDAITYPDNTHEYFTYNEKAFLESMYRDDGVGLVTLTYGEHASVTIADANGSSTTLFYNNDGQVVHTEGNKGPSMQAQYNGFGQPSVLVDAAGFASTFAYDADGRLVAATNPLGATTQFRYVGESDLLDQHIDPAGNVTDYDYTPSGMLERITYADGSTESWTYDAAGNTLSWINRRGQTTQYSYDTQGRMISYSLENGDTFTYAYDAVGNLTSTTDPNGETAFTYNEKNEVVQVAYPDGRSLSYTYDALGRRESMADHLGNSTFYEYDPQGRLARLTDGDGEELVRYSFDTSGRLARIDKGNGTYTLYSYDTDSQVTSMVHHAPDGTINSRFDYEYDIRGLRTSMTTLDGRWDYEYDTIGQLTHAVFVSTNPEIEDQDLTYVYDLSGNRVQTIINGEVTDYTANELNQYTQIGGAICSYDADGNLIQKVTPEETLTYVYDQSGRLVSVTSDQSDTWEYKYNSLGSIDSVLHNGEVTKHLNDPLGQKDLVGRYDEDAELINRLVQGYGLVGTEQADGQYAMFDIDASGSVGSVTDVSGAVANNYSYTPYGNLIAKNETMANPHQFGGNRSVIAGPSGISVSTRSGGVYDTSSNYRIGSSSRIRVGYTKSIRTNAVSETGQETDGFLAGFNSWDVSKSAGVKEVREIAGGLGESYSRGALACLTRDVPGAIEQLANMLGYFDRGSAITDAGWAFDNHMNDTPPTSTPGKSEFGVANDLIKQYLDYRRIEDIANSIKHHLSRIRNQEWIELLWEKIDWEKVYDGTLWNWLAAKWTTFAVRSTDPNDKIGPVGYGEPQYVMADSVMPYTIRFENVATASAPAQWVRVHDTLDEDLDLDTFQLTEFMLAGESYLIPGSLGSYHTQIPRTIEGHDLVIDVQIELNRDTRELVSSFMAVDPTTGWMPEDPLVGLLYPNDEFGRGEGHVSFVVMPKEDVASGVRIENEARIYFDHNDPIDTPLVFNTLDADAPTSEIKELPDLAAPEFIVSWIGDDGDGSGVRAWDIYVSENGGDWVLWLDDTINTQAAFVGEPDTTYAFYSVAQDHVGLVEAKMPVIEATTTTVDAAFPNVLAVDTTAEAMEVWFSQPMDVQASIDDGSIQNHVALIGMTSGDVDLSGATFTYETTQNVLHIDLVDTLPEGDYELTLDGIHSDDGLALIGGSGESVRFTLPDFAAEEVIQTDNVEVQVDAYSTPSLADWNADGLLDLIVGEKTDASEGKVRVYLNTGSAEAAVYDTFFYAQSEGTDLTVDASGCLGAFARMHDWNRDGKLDLLVGLADGTINWYENTSETDDPLFGPAQAVQAGFADQKTPIDIGDRATFDIVDWNDDGRFDLVTGGLDGSIRIYENTQATGLPDLMPYAFALSISGSPIGVPSGRASVAVADLNGDGRKDLLVGNTEGQLLFYPNRGTKSEPRFGSSEKIKADGTTIDLEGSPRNRPFVGDYNDDGIADLLVGAQDGQIRLYAGLNEPGQSPFPSIEHSLPGETFTYSYTLPPLEDDPEPLGRIDYFQKTFDSNISDRVNYHLVTTRAGMLSFAISDLTGQPISDVTMELFDGQANLLESGSRIDYPDASAETAYFVRISGNLAGRTLAIANLLQQNGSELAVFDSSNADQFSLLDPAQRRFAVNRLEYDFSGDAIDSVFFGSGPEDTVTVSGTPGDDLFSLTSEGLLYEHDGVTWNTTGSGQMMIDGNEGKDAAILNGTAEAERFVLAPHRGTLQSEDSTVFVQNVSSITALASGDSQDTVTLIDSSGTDQANISGQNAQIYGNDFINTAMGFAQIEINAENGGYDRVFFSGEEGEESFVSLPHRAILTGDTSRHIARGFDAVEVIGLHADDHALLYGSRYSDWAKAAKGTAILHRREDRSSTRIWGAGTIEIDAGRGGFDQVWLTDSSADDVAIHDADSGVTTFALATSPEQAYLTTWGFERTVMRATRGGEDSLDLYDSSGDDLLEVQADHLRFFENAQGEEALYRMLAEAYLFEQVEAHGERGGTNRKDEKVDPQDLLFELIYSGDWEE